LGPANHHDMIGRVAVELSSLKVNTEYILTFQLFEETITSKRKPRGSITIRLRIEYHSQKEVVLSNLKLSTDFFVNMRKKKNYEVMQGVLQGKTDLTKYSQTTLLNYVDELCSYLHVQYYIQDAIVSLFLWRDQVSLPVFSRVRIPVHSAIAFYAATTLVENPFLFFPYFWFANAWLLLSIQNWRNGVPNPWLKTRTFSEIFIMFVLDKAINDSETIPSNYKMKESIDFEEKMQKRIAKAKADADKRQEEQQDYDKKKASMNLEADTDISTQGSVKEGMLLNPMKTFLFPIQQILATVCGWLRVLRNIYFWKEPYFAFLLTAISLVLGIVFYFIPWAFIIRWMSRILAWGVFGPHMKLVDAFYYSKLKGMTDEEATEQIVKQFKSLELEAKATADLAFKQTEDAVKLKAVKEVLFGSWVSRIPVIKQERYNHTPLFQSSAKPIDEEQIPCIDELKILKVGGQKLVGTMIPKVSYDYEKEKSE